MLTRVFAMQPALSYTAPELVVGAQQSVGGLFSAADVFSLGGLSCSAVFDYQRIHDWR